MNNIRIGTEVDQSGLQSGLKGMRSQVDSTIRSLTTGMTPATAAFAAAGVAATAFGAKLKSVIDAADRIEEMSHKLGVTTTQFQKLEFMAGRAGVEVDFFKKTFAGISAEVAKGGEAFNNFGISTTKTNGQLKNNNELLEEAMIVIANIVDPAERSAAAIELLGKKGMELAPVFNEGADAVRAYFKESEKAVSITAKQALEAAKVKDSVEDLTMSWNKIVTGGMAQFIPIAQSTIEAFDQMTPAIEKLTSIVATATNMFINFVSIPAVQYITALTVALVALPPILTLVGGAITALQVNLMLLALNPVVAALTAITLALVAVGAAAVYADTRMNNLLAKQAEFMESGSEGYSKVLESLTRLNELQDKSTRTKEEAAEMKSLRKEIESTTGYTTSLNKATGEWVTRAGDAEMTMRSYETAVKAAGLQLGKLQTTVDADFSEKIKLEYETNDLQRSLNDAKARHKKFNDDLVADAKESGANASKAVIEAEKKQSEEIATIKKKYRQEEAAEQKAERERRLAEELIAITYAEDLKQRVLATTYGKSQDQIFNDQIELINLKYDKELERIKELEDADNKRRNEIFNDIDAIAKVEALRQAEVAGIETQRQKTGIKSNPIWTKLDEESIISITSKMNPEVFKGGVNSSLKNIGAIVGNTPLNKGLETVPEWTTTNWFNLDNILGSIATSVERWENPMKSMYDEFINIMKSKAEEIQKVLDENTEIFNNMTPEEKITPDADGEAPTKTLENDALAIKKVTGMVSYYKKLKEDASTTEADYITQDAITKSVLISNMKKHTDMLMKIESEHNGSRLNYIRNYKDMTEEAAREELDGRIALVQQLNAEILLGFEKSGLKLDNGEAQESWVKEQTKKAQDEYDKIVELIPQITAEAKQKLKNESTMTQLLFGDPTENQEAFGRHLQEAADMAQQVASVTFSMIDSISAYKQLDRDIEMNAVKTKHELELESIGNNGRKRKAIEKRQAEEMNELQKKYKKEAVKVKIAELLTSIPINAAMAFGQAMANFPPPAGPIIGGISAAAVVANGIIGVVNARKEAENFAEGGIVGGRSYTGDRVPANVNSGEAILTMQQQKTFMNIANGKRSGSSSAPQPINIQIMGDVTNDKLIELEDMLYRLQSSGRIKLFD